MHPKDLSISAFTYDLPEDRIAKFPLQERDASKLLVYHNGKITQDIYKNLDHYLPSHSLLVFNDSKVIEARLLFQKSTGGMIEIFCLEPHGQYADITSAMTQRGRVLWQCLIGGASKWKHGQVLEKKLKIGERGIILHAKYVEKNVDAFVIEFSWNDDTFTFAEILHMAGAVPLPPYLKREPQEVDKERYQTIYAHYEGSVAAPTAGLHFTDRVLEKLKQKNIDIDFVTLHVGAGTFKPVKTATMKEHEMHAEFISVTRMTIQNILDHLAGKIIAVGTTSLRTIESLYWLGVKLKIGQARDLFVSQWEPYDLVAFDVSPAEAIKTLLDFMNARNMERLLAKTQVIIAPSYKVKLATGLISNFHQPQSTLLLLVAALVGDDWKKIYDFALKNDFRFLSYGDGCLLWFDENYAGTGDIRA
jgi:S-adenosylmethionine:tRNA ribosyltransferase-isomerase